MFSIERPFFTGGSFEVSLRRRCKPLNWFTSDSVSYASWPAPLQ
jgi:hypothetical protein